MIQVVNKYKHVPTKDDCFIGRPSPLGNPYSHMAGTTAIFTVSSREEAVQKYEEYLTSAVNDNVRVKTEIDRLVQKAVSGDLNLVCYCKPKACHGDVIKKVIEERMNKIDRSIG